MKVQLKVRRKQPSILDLKAELKKKKTLLNWLVMSLDLCSTENLSSELNSFSAKINSHSGPLKNGRKYQKEATQIPLLLLN